GGGWGGSDLEPGVGRLRRNWGAGGVCQGGGGKVPPATLDLALRVSGLDQTKPTDRPRLLSDNGSSYIAGDLAKWLNDRHIKHLCGAPYHPMTQGKIERWHQTLKNRILLENYFLPGDLEAQIAAFIDDYNHRRYHESIDNLTPADVYCGRGPTILAERQRIKRQTIANPRLQHRLQAARQHHIDAPEPPLIFPACCLKNPDDGHKEPRNRARRGRGHAVRSRLCQPVFRYQCREDGRRAGGTLHPSAREEAVE